jgi:hypothetical protein
VNSHKHSKVNNYPNILDIIFTIFINIPSGILFIKFINESTIGFSKRIFNELSSNQVSEDPLEFLSKFIIFSSMFLLTGFAFTSFDDDKEDFGLTSNLLSDSDLLIDSDTSLDTLSPLFFVLELDDNPFPFALLELDDDPSPLLKLGIDSSFFSISLDDVLFVFFSLFFASSIDS